MVVRNNTMRSFKYPKFMLCVSSSLVERVSVPQIPTLQEHRHLSWPLLNQRGLNISGYELVAISGPKKVSIFRAHPSSGPRNGFSCFKIIIFHAIKKNRYFGNFMYMSFCILYSVLCDFYVHEFCCSCAPIQPLTTPPSPLAGRSEFTTVCPAPLHPYSPLYSTI